MTRSQNHTIPSLQLAIYFGKQWIPFGEPNLPFQAQFLTEGTTLYILFITENHYQQLIFCYITDNKTCIDHIYTNIHEHKIQANVS